MPSLFTIRSPAQEALQAPSAPLPVWIRRRPNQIHARTKTADVVNDLALGWNNRIMHEFGKAWSTLGQQQRLIFIWLTSHNTLDSGVKGQCRL